MRMNRTKSTTLPVKRQYVERFTPRQSAFIRNYLDPTSETYNNGLQSALRAGYAQKYAEQLVSRDLPWLDAISDTVSTEEIVKEARKNIRNAVKGKLDRDNEHTYRYKASEFALSRADKDFTEKKQMDVTSAGLPIQENVINALLKVYSDEEQQ